MFSMEERTALCGLINADRMECDWPRLRGLNLIIAKYQLHPQIGYMLRD